MSSLADIFRVMRLEQPDKLCYRCKLSDLQYKGDEPIFYASKRDWPLSSSQTSLHCSRNRFLLKSNISFLLLLLAFHLVIQSRGPYFYVNIRESWDSSIQTICIQKVVSCSSRAQVTGGVLPREFNREARGDGSVIDTLS